MLQTLLAIKCFFSSLEQISIVNLGLIFSLKNQTNFYRSGEFIVTQTAFLSVQGSFYIGTKSAIMFFFLTRIVLDAQTQLTAHSCSSDMFFSMSFVASSFFA